MSELKMNGKYFSEWFFEQDLLELLWDIKDTNANLAQIKMSVERLGRYGYTAFPYHNGDIVLLSVDDSALDRLYLDWANNYITVGGFASGYSISERSAKTFLDAMRKAA